MTSRTLVQALLTDGPLKGRLVEVEPVEGRPRDDRHPRR